MPCYSHTLLESPLSYKVYNVAYKTLRYRFDKEFFFVLFNQHSTVIVLRSTRLKLDIQYLLFTIVVLKHTHFANEFDRIIPYIPCFNEILRKREFSRELEKMFWEFSCQLS